MSVQLFGEDTLFLQRFLQGTGFCKGDLNGIYDEKTDSAINVFEVGLITALEWSGNWKSFKNKPHYQWATGLVLASVRDKF